MASSLLELRRQAGYATAKEFAQAEGIAEATYARYESSPEKIPTKAAWKLADRFGVSIDVIVGHADVDVTALKGDVQAVFDHLSRQSQASALDYLAFLAKRDEDAARAEREEQQRRYDAVCYRMEQLFLAKLERNDEELFAFGTAEELRAAFEEFVEGRADERQDPEARASVPQIMAAYDRTHGSFRYGNMTVLTSKVDLGNPHVRAEYERAAGKRAGSKA